MRIGAAIVLGVLIILMGVQIGVFYHRKSGLEKDFAQIMESAKKAEADYQKLEADYQYYQNPANLEKELRARFNYRSPDEQLIIMVPKASSTQTSTE